jgi:curved DNA binding protein
VLCITPAEEDDDDISDVVSDEEEGEEDEESSNDLSNADIVTKYRCAGDIVNKVLQAVCAACKPGVRAVELANIGDAAVEDATGKIYNQKKGGKKIEKGSAFPTCISVNNCVGHYSPLTSEDKVVLAEGDIVKVDLGVHVDGYCAVAAHTCVCTAGTDPLTGRKADVVMAAWTAAECAQRMLKDGCENAEVTKMIAQVAESFKCSPVEGVLSHQMKKHVIDANKTIINKATADQQVPDAKIAKNDVFAIDIVMSTGEGKPKQMEDRTTVFKRNIEEKYSLKMKASRAFFSEVNQRFPTMPFTLRAGDEKAWRMGVVECVKHDLFIEYPVLYEKPEEFVAQYKFTCLMLPSGNTARITSGGPVEWAKSELSLEDEGLKELMAQSTDKKKKKKNKKKGGGEGGDAVEVS